MNRNKKESLKCVSEYFFKKINNDSEIFARAMNHILQNSEHCTKCQERMNKYPGMKNKFCAKGKITFINYRSGETVWTNPKDYLRYWAKELKNCLKEVDENKTKYEKYISWFDTDLKKKEADYKWKFEQQQKIYRIQ